MTITQCFGGPATLLIMTAEKIIKNSEFGKNKYFCVYSKYVIIILNNNIEKYVLLIFNRLTPNDPYMGCTAPLTSKRCILYTYSTNIGTEYFKHALYSSFFSLQNAVCFIMLTYLVPVLFTFYI